MQKGAKKRGIIDGGGGGGGDKKGKGKEGTRGHNGLIQPRIKQVAPPKYSEMSDHRNGLMNIRENKKKATATIKLRCGEVNC